MNQIQVYQSEAQIFMNLDTFNKLPPNLQKLVVEVALEVEAKESEHFRQAALDNKQVLIDNGVEVVVLSPKETDLFLQRAYENGWEEVKEAVSPEIYKKIREYLVK